MPVLNLNQPPLEKKHGRDVATRIMMDKIALYQLIFQ
jgi:hypothetical protein